MPSRAGCPQAPSTHSPSTPRVRFERFGTLQALRDWNSRQARACESMREHSYEARQLVRTKKRCTKSGVTQHGHGRVSFSPCLIAFAEPPVVLPNMFSEGVRTTKPTSLKARVSHLLSPTSSPASPPANDARRPQRAWNFG